MFSPLASLISGHLFESVRIMFITKAFDLITVNLFNENNKDQLDHFGCFFAGCSCVNVSQRNHPLDHRSASGTVNHESSQFIVLG